MPMSLGLNALMEAMKQSEQSEASSVSLFETFSDTVDDDVKAMVAGDDYASDMGDVESDMAGLGIDEEDEEKYKKLVAMIPEDDEGIEDQIEDITESFLEAAGEVIF